MVSTGLAGFSAPRPGLDPGPDCATHRRSPTEPGEGRGGGGGTVMSGRQGWTVVDGSLRGAQMGLGL